jgi:hypothetical protein
VQQRRLSWLLLVLTQLLLLLLLLLWLVCGLAACVLQVMLHRACPARCCASLS